MKSKLQTLCEEKNYAFVSQRPQGDNLVIRFTAADSVLAADDDEIKKELLDLIEVLQTELTALAVSTKQYQVKPQWEAWTLHITAEAAVLDKIADLLQTAGVAYFPSLTAARSALFYSSPQRPSASPPQAPTVTCLLQ